MRQMVMDERPASVLAACVVTYVGSFGGVTIANVLLGLASGACSRKSQPGPSPLPAPIPMPRPRSLPPQPLLMFEDPYIVFLTMAITWLIDYAPNKVRDLLSSRPVTVAVTALHRRGSLCDDCHGLRIDPQRCAEERTSCPGAASRV